MKLRILMLIDRPGWAYDVCAQGLAKQLDDLYDFVLRRLADVVGLVEVLGSSGCADQERDGGAKERDKLSIQHDFSPICAEATR